MEFGIIKIVIIKNEETPIVNSKIILGKDNSRDYFYDKIEEWISNTIEFIDEFTDIDREKWTEEHEKEFINEDDFLYALYTNENGDKAIFQWSYVYDENILKEYNSI